MTSTVEQEAVKRLSDANPGYETFVSELYTLLSSSSQPSIYVHDPISPRRTSQVISSVLQELTETCPDTFRSSKINAVACFTTRLLYDSVLNGLARWSVKWADGCKNWSEDEKRWNDSMDGFLHGLQAIAKTLCEKKNPSTSERNRTIQDVGKDEMEGQMVLVVERAERLKETLPDLLVPLTRLADLARVNITTILLSCVRWEDVRPPLGVSPEPFFFEIPPSSPQSTISYLKRLFLAASASSVMTAASPYNPSLLPLYHHFASVLYSVCSPFIQEPDELAYISAARWPGFVQAILAEHREKTARGEGDEPPLGLPGEDTRMRFIRMFTPSFTAALESLYPRAMDAQAWAEANPDVVVMERGTVGADEDVDSLPRMARYILVAAFLASTNPAKTDMRMFGRGLDEKRRRRRGGGASRKGAGEGKVAKVPQRLLGPAPFPLDRLLAILGALLEENDVESRPPAPEFVFPGEYTEMEIGRTQVYALIMDLAGAKLLHRTSPPDRLDASSTFKCGISHDTALRLARGLDISLNDLMWHPP